MANCERIKDGLDMSCGGFNKKYAQQVVIVNRSDVEFKVVYTPQTEITAKDVCRYRVYFKLLDGATGYRFTMNQNAAAIFGTAEKTVEEGIPQYMHVVNMALLGVSEENKCILSRLDYADYFAALQYGDGVIEVYGFDYGLSTADYVYDPANTGGGALLKLSSESDGLEDELPYIYVSSIPGNEILDFDNLFAENTFDVPGDFNDDFNNDFNNQES